MHLLYVLNQICCNQQSIILPWIYRVNILYFVHKQQTFPDSKVHVTNMGPTWVLSALDGPHAGPMNFQGL